MGGGISFSLWPISISLSRFYTLVILKIKFEDTILTNLPDKHTWKVRQYSKFEQ